MYGPSVLGGVVDEFGMLTTEGYAAISSRRAETLIEGCGHFTYLGNVGEMGGVAEHLWRMAEDGRPGFAHRRWTWRDRAIAEPCACEVPLTIANADDHSPLCPRGVYCGFIAREAERMSASQFRQLYEAEWVDWNELPVYQFDRQVHTREMELQPTLPVQLSCDFNVDPMAWIVGQSKGNEAWALDEIAIPGGATTEEACREFIRRYPNPRLTVEVYGDASGSARKTSASRTDYQIIRELLGSQYLRFSMHVPKANPPVIDRINAVNGMLKPAKGRPRYFLHSKCKGLATDYARVSYKPGTRDIDKTNKGLTHYSDADGYRLAAKFAIRSPGRIAAVGRSAVRAEPVMGRF
jgi:hypothetical protein